MKTSMTIMISIDPGTQGIGLAVWYPPELLCAAYVPLTGETLEARVQSIKTILKAPTLACCDRLVLEYPQIYRGTPADPNDLLGLALVDGALLACISTPNAQLVLPREWKGTVKKDVMCRRIESRLTPIEQRRLKDVKKSVRHNMVDAVGIGLWALGRL